LSLHPDRLARLLLVIARVQILGSNCARRKIGPLPLAQAFNLHDRAADEIDFHGAALAVSLPRRSVIGALRHPVAEIPNNVAWLAHSMDPPARPPNARSRLHVGFDVKAFNAQNGAIERAEVRISQID
jgi:hypothetical protein